MAQYQVNDPEDYLECPYDKTHMVRAKRFPYHLMKCRKNNPNMDMVPCPFNARHTVPRVELRYHTSRCPDKARLEQDFTYDAQSKNDDDGKYFRGNCSVPSYDNGVHIPPMEQWDNECGDSVWVMNGKEEIVRPAPPPRVTTTTRPPQSVPLVLQQMKAAPPDSTANPLNMSGLGRGRSPMVGAIEQASMPNGVSPLGVNQVYNENSILLEALARGRGIGRGILTVVDAKPGQLRAPVPAASKPGRHTGLGMTATAPRKPPSLTARQHLIGPRRVNAPVMSLSGGFTRKGPPKTTGPPMVAESKPKPTQPTVIAVGRGRGLAGSYMNGVEPGVNPSFVVPNTNRIHQLMKPSDFSCSSSMVDDEDIVDQLTEEEVQELAHKKEVRKQQKRLRKIEELEKKYEEGQSLDNDQLEKITCKSNVMEQLAMLGTQR